MLNLKVFQEFQPRQKLVLWKFSGMYKQNNRLTHLRRGRINSCKASSRKERNAPNPGVHDRFDGVSFAQQVNSFQSLEAGEKRQDGHGQLGSLLHIEASFQVRPFLTRRPMLVMLHGDSQKSNLVPGTGTPDPGPHAR